MQRLRLEDVEADVAEIRGLTAEHDHSETDWMLGPSTEPAGLYEQLVALGATEPDRALVRTRWDEAVRRGTPALVVHAAPTSEPILRRLGFEEVCRLRRLRDPA